MTDLEKKELRRTKWKERYAKNKNTYLAKKKEQKRLNPDHYKQQAKSIRDRRKGKKRVYSQNWDFERKVRIKMEVMDHYGGVCQICGESHLECLTIGHSFNDGAEFRRTRDDLKFSGIQFYYWLKQNNFPDDLGLRVLCWNCNCSIGAYGYSPYEEK